MIIWTQVLNRHQVNGKVRNNTIAYRDGWKSSSSSTGRPSLTPKSSKFIERLHTIQFFKSKCNQEIYITITGEHEEQMDDTGYIARHFIRRFMIPENISGSHVTTHLSKDGILTVKAPPRKLSHLSPHPRQFKVPMVQLLNEIKMSKHRKNIEEINICCT
ncbi:hypothetical protein CEXT_333411 [Caerostris extrusa]|uniref:SHSP domain-containing protein n=1 Tax=Caerostris extrusa TaxID=172846 RepID=A0AAV4NDW4_CAEEX|nr:hypothetical protein CEXT_333411 [Caerostris extrusa]